MAEKLQTINQAGTMAQQLEEFQEVMRNAPTPLGLSPEEAQADQRWVSAAKERHAKKQQEST